MIKNGILNPDINHLLSRIRHTNMLVISDRGFPYWPMIETVDISLVDGIPSVLQVFSAVISCMDICEIYMAEEFKLENSINVQNQFINTAQKTPITFEPHVKLKTRVPNAIGLIRTGDTIQYANMVLVSGRID
jgi:D-ribose pyranase